MKILIIMRSIYRSNELSFGNKCADVISKLSFILLTTERALKAPVPLQDNAANKASYEREFTTLEFVLKVKISIVKY
jgi:hypothetical protein